VLNTSNKVYRYDPAAKSLNEVASAGSTVSWRSVTFTPDGTKAVLLGNVNPPAEEGRIYLWDSATSTLSEMPSTAQPQITYEALAWSPDKSTARLLGAKKNGSTWLAYLWNFDPSTGLSNLKANATSAMCQGLAWATDSFDRPAVAVTCGGNGVTLFHVDFDGQVVKYLGNAGNTSHISGRPQGDYALAVGWSGQRVYRFQQGGWDTDFENPTLPGIYQVQFSTDGRRALLLGGFGKIYEFRHDLMEKVDFIDASIPNFASPPYNAESQVALNDAAWRPGCEGGLLVGGANTYSIQKGYVIRFSIQNGVACPD
jgi:WD40 repeat protein